MKKDENGFIDLDDLVQSVKFKFSDMQFEIPPIPDDKLKSIMAIANKITKATKEEDGGLMDEKSNEEFIKNQNTFLAMSVQKKGENDNFNKMKASDFTSWPLKLKNKVMELVFEQVGTSSGEDVPVDSEKN